MPLIEDEKHSLMMVIMGTSFSSKYATAFSEFENLSPQTRQARITKIEALSRFCMLDSVIKFWSWHVQKGLSLSMLHAIHGRSML